MTIEIRGGSSGTVIHDGDVEIKGGLTLEGVSYGLPSADGTNGQALTTNGSGVLSWSTVAGGGGDFADGGEAGGANRTLGNTDAFALAFLTNNLERISIASGGAVTIGNVAITGGSVVGITDITVADGGSGRSSSTAYAVVCGGTTSTAAHQSIAGVGTSGQVLTSNGAAALPTFQTNPAAEFADGGEVGGANRTLGNTDAFALGFLTNNLIRLQIDSAGLVGIGIAPPQALLHVGDGNALDSSLVNAAGPRAVFSREIDPAFIEIIAAAGTPSFQFKKALGTLGTPLVVADADILGLILFGGHDGTATIASADIRGIVDGTPGTDVMPTKLSFFTTTTNSRTERLTIRADGAISIPNGTSTVVPFTVKGAVGQSVNLQEWTDSTDTVLSGMDEAGQLGVTIAVPQAPLHVGDGNAVAAALVGAFDDFILSKEADFAVMNFITAADDDRPAVFRGTRARGTLGTPTAILDTHRTASFSGVGYDGAALQSTAGLVFTVDGTVSSGVVPQKMTFATGETNSSTVRMTIKPDGKVGLGNEAPSTVFHIDSNAANTTAIMTIENTAGDIQLFRTDATPESAVTGSIGDLAVDGTNGTFYIKETGSATNTGWKLVTVSAAAFTSLWYHGAEVTTTISTANLFTKITHFENEGPEDVNGNAVGDSTTDDDITIGANGAGDYNVGVGASFRNASGTNKSLYVVPKIVLSSAKTITGATNATPIVMTVTGHGLKNGDMVTQASVGGNTAANGDFAIANKTANTYELQDLSHTNVAGTGAYTSGGTVDAIYPGQLLMEAVVSGTDLERGFGGGLVTLVASDVLELVVANTTDTNNAVFSQITFNIRRVSPQ